MIGHGTITTKAAIHGLIINTLHSLLTIQHIAENGTYNFKNIIIIIIIIIAIKNIFYVLNVTNCFIYFS